MKKTYKNIEKPGKNRQIYRKNLRNFKKKAKTNENIEKMSKM